MYRGPSGALPAGTYVYGDYCTRELFGWNGSTQTLLLDTALNVSCFGEDEDGELYVVGLGGTISRLTRSAPCTFAIAPALASYSSRASNGSVTVTAGVSCPWTAMSNVPWLTVTSGTSGSGNGAVTYAVAPCTGKPKSRTGTITIAGRTFAVKPSK